MSTRTTLDKICVVIVVCSLLLTVLFINGQALGLTKIVDEDADQNSDTEYFTSKDQDGDWDSSEATVITLNGDETVISGNGAYTSDGNVVIKNAGYYVVSGTLTDGYLSVDAYDSSKVFIRLDGVEINCSDDACIRVEKADKVFLTLAEGSLNTLTSGSTYSEQALKDGTDGAIFAHDDLTINGSGSLTVNAAYRHGIAANDDLIITGGTITVNAAADAVHAKDSLRIKEAAITVEAGDDGLVASNEEENGYLYIESGTINITAVDDGIHTTGDITLAGGDITVSAGDDGIHSDSAIFFQDGTVLINTCYEGVEALIIDVSGGDITVYARDDGFNANGNSDSQIGAGGMGGGMDRGMGSRTGMHGPQDTGSASSTSTGDFTASTGTMPTPPDMNSGNMPAPSGTDSMASAGDMPAPPDMGSGNMPTPPGTGSTASDGDMQAPPEMNANMNSGDGSTQSATAANDEETYISISGGTVTIINESGNDADGLDSNGDIFISGGTIHVSLTGSGSNSAVDYGSESGGVAEISGGTIIACGASSMAEAFDSSSTQASILYNTSTVAEAGTTLAVKNAAGDVLLSWEVPCSFSSALVSCPQMEKGSTYTVVIGDDTEEITLEEISASYGDAQSSMFGGNMNWGGMKHRGGRFNNNLNNMNQDGMSAGTTSTGSADTGSTDTAAAAVMDGMQGRPDGGQMPPDMTAMQDASQDGSTQAGQMPSDMSHGGMTGGPMQERQEQQEQKQSQEEEDDAAAEKSNAEPVDPKTWCILGGCTLLLLAGIAVGKLYQRH
ncbi:MAG: carbohydrate-binding domain-containing protein [Eubacteriales bacterium]|nr:carbohydrate-binding domain-containing protein [Eubacteriales bacterium]